MHSALRQQGGRNLVEDAARQVLGDKARRSLLMYINQYERGKLDIDMLAVALIDILDTPEKVMYIAENKKTNNKQLSICQEN